MAKANGSIANDATLAVVIDGQPREMTEVPMSDEEIASLRDVITQAEADETLIFMCRELAKRARGAGDETLAWLLETAYKRARGGRR